MNPMLIAEKLTDIDDRYILESDPVVGVFPVRQPRTSALSRFLNSGVFAALISGAVALGVLVIIIMAGREAPVTPPVSTKDTAVTESTEDENESAAEPIIESTEDESETATESTEGESETHTEPVTEEITEAVTENIIDTPEEVEARKDELIAILDALDYKWNILNDPSYYFDQYIPVKAFGKYGVPYMLEYIMAHEGETDPEELKRLGVILHFAYHNLGITHFRDWYQGDKNSTNVFVNTGWLIENLEEHGLSMPSDNSETTEGSTKETGSPL